MRIDHLILHVNDREDSLRFYTGILGLTHEGRREPFDVIRVDRDFVIQLAAFGTKRSEHLAFSVSEEEFEAVFARIREAGLAYGDAFDRVGNGRAPGEAEGARGAVESIYCFDPSGNLIEIARDAKLEGLSGG